MGFNLPTLNRRRRNGGAPAPAFSPSTLYSSGATGIWLDPSDLSTMFSDRAGTTPVTAPGTVVGLRLDKSKGLALGSELVSNPGPFANTTAWTAANGATVSVSGSNLRVTSNGSNTSPRAYVAISTVIGQTYKFTSLLSQVSGTFVTSPLVTKADNTAWSTNALYAIAVFTATATTTYVAVQASSAVSSVVVFDVVSFSVRELPGNHAVAPTDAARPIYGVEPKGGRRNLLLATDTLATQSLTVTAVAHTLAFTGTGTVTLSGASTAGPLVGTGAGNRVSLTFTPTAASLTLTVSGSVTLGQLQLGSTDTAYQKVTNAYDVTESGVPTCHYVQYDGSNSSMSTAAIDFTSTDKMSVFAGVRKLSDAGSYSTIIETSVEPFANAGTIQLNGRSTFIPAGDYGWASKGTVFSGVAASSYVAPISNIVTGLGNISGDASTLRVNGVQAATSTADQGSGNFGNYPLFIGRRNNATLPFSGKDYGIIVVGKAASAGEITDTETWLAAKTSGVTL